MKLFTVTTDLEHGIEIAVAWGAPHYLAFDVPVEVSDACRVPPAGQERGYHGKDKPPEGGHHFAVPIEGCRKVSRRSIFRHCSYPSLASESFYLEFLFATASRLYFLENFLDGFPGWQAAELQHPSVDLAESELFFVHEVCVDFVGVAGVGSVNKTREKC